MTLQPFANRQRAMLQRLLDLAVDRTRTDLEIQGKLANGASAAEKEREKAVEDANSRFDRETAEAQRRHAAAVATITNTHEADLAGATRSMDAKLAAFEERTKSLEQTAEKKLEESIWLAETLVESGETKGAAEYENLRLAFTARLKELDQLVEIAESTLSKRGHKPLPPRAQLQVTPPPAAANGTATELNFGQSEAEGVDQLITQIREAQERAVAEFERLRRRMDPPLLGPIAILIVAVAMAVGGGIVAARLIVPLRTEMVALGAGAGLVVGAVVMILMRFLAAFRVPAAARTFAQAVFDAHNGVERRLATAAVDRDAKLASVRAKRDEEVERAKERHAEATEQIKRRREQDEPLIRETCVRAISAVETTFREASAREAAVFQSATQTSRRVRDEAIRAADERRSSILLQLRTEYDEARHRQNTKWRAGMASAADDRDWMIERGAELFPAWNDPRWESPVFPVAVPDVVKFGQIDVDLATLPGGLPEDESLRIRGSGAFTLPVGLDLTGRGSLLIQHGPEMRDAAMRVLQNVMLRVLATIPPGKARFTIVDPVGLGQNFAAFMHLADADPLLVSDRIWTDTRHIETKLADLTEHMENVIQKYLRNEFAAIQEYNERAGEIAEPYRFLVIADFPASFNEACCKRLASIVATGARCGVFTLIAADMRQRPPAYVPMGEIEKYSNHISVREGKFVWNDADYSRWPLRLEEAPEPVFTPIVREAGKQAKESGRVQVPFEVAAPSEERTWSASAADEIRVPLGRSGATKLQNLSLGRGTSQHVLIAGRTGSGKSTLLHAMITNTALWYSPDEVEFYLVDFKKGVEFKTYATHALPHARVIAVESEREFGISVLRRLDAELTRRGTMFREVGAQDLAGYRSRVPDAILPRVMFIVDEFQEFFVEDDKLAGEAALLLDRLVRQGRAFGMHVILGSQTVGGAYSLARSTLGQMAIRIALQCSEADSYLIMSEDNAAARLLSRPGEAIYNDQSGRMEGNSPFQVVWLPDEKRDVFLERVERMQNEAQHTHKKPPPPAPIIFEGNVPSDLTKNDALAQLIDSRSATVPAVRPPPRLWLGEAISIKDPTAAVFRRQAGANALIVGQQETSVVPLIISGIVSLAAFSSTDPAAPAADDSSTTLPGLCILDGLPADGEESQSISRAASALNSTARLARPGLGPRSADSLIAELAAELDKRQLDESRAERRIFVIIVGLHRFRSLRKSEDDFGFSASGDAAAKPDQQLAKILREGPTFGIHAVVWCDTMANVERCLDRRVIREFDQRVAFQMSATDSSALIDSPAAANLGRHRALFHSEEQGVIEKFRPYAMPHAPWLDSTLTRIAATGVRG
jgi:DNA segregation ATPase FtsK/SpoIIIE, S-DNA-T family